MFSSNGLFGLLLLSIILAVMGMIRIVRAWGIVSKTWMIILSCLLTVVIFFPLSFMFFGNYYAHINHCLDIILKKKLCVECTYLEQLADVPPGYYHYSYDAVKIDDELIMEIVFPDIARKLSMMEKLGVFGNNRIGIESDEVSINKVDGVYYVVIEGGGGFTVKMKDRLFTKEIDITGQWIHY